MNTEALSVCDSDTALQPQPAHGLPAPADSPAKQQKLIVRTAPHSTENWAEIIESISEGES